MAAVDTTKPLTAEEYDALAKADDAAGDAAWNDGRIKTATTLWRSAARWTQYARQARGAAPVKAAVAYSVATAGYTIEQLEGETCALCGETFEPGQDLEQVWQGDDYDLFAHVECTKAGATR